MSYADSSGQTPHSRLGNRGRRSAEHVVGLACLRYSFAEPLVRLSYDLPFLWRTTLDTHEITLVYLDESSAKQLNQPLDDVWNRALHVRLLTINSSPGDLGNFAWRAKLTA